MASRRSRPLQVEPAAGSCSDNVFAVLKSRILGFEFAPGDALTELGMAQELKVSRTPVREALRRLEHEQLVRIIPRKGAIVTGLSEEDIREAYLIRQALEGISARRAAKLLSDNSLERLEESLRLAAKKLAENDRDAASTAADELHRVVLAVGGTPRIRRMVANLRDLTARLHELALMIPGRLERSIEEHLSVLQALRARDGDEAERRIRAHIVSTEGDMLATYRNRRTEKIGR